MATYTEYHAYWKGPFTARYNEETGRYAIDLPVGVGDRHGLYAIYGFHPVYGPDALLYIGMTAEGESMRGFKVRLAEHFASNKKKTGLFWYARETTVYVATVYDEAETAEIQTAEGGLGLVESLLIASHTPAMNQQSIHIPTREAQNVLLYNYESRGSLLPICSGRWFDYGPQTKQA